MSIIGEFKEFINRGNVIDLAVAVVLGAAFTAVVNAFVADFISPIIALFTGGIELSSLVITLSSTASIKYGAFIMSLLNFLIVTFIIFLIVKLINKIMRRKPVDIKDCPYCGSAIPVTAVRCPSCTTLLDASKVPENLR